jgi:hypothetical protein
MSKLPKKVTTLIPAEKILQIENWWNKLSPENQKELSSLYLQEQQSDPQLIAIQLCGQYVEQDYTNAKHNTFWLRNV